MDKTQISVSGISSGAAMATQMHVIYSSDIMGVGMIAGGKYRLALSFRDVGYLFIHFDF